MFIQAIAQSAIARSRKLRASWVGASARSGNKKSGFVSTIVLLIVFVLILMLGLK